MIGHHGKELRRQHNLELETPSLIQIAATQITNSCIHLLSPLRQPDPIVLGFCRRGNGENSGAAGAQRLLTGMLQERQDPHAPPSFLVLPPHLNCLRFRKCRLRGTSGIWMAKRWRQRSPFCPHRMTSLVCGANKL